MKRAKKVLSITIILCLLAALPVPAFAADAPIFTSADEAGVYVRGKMVERQAQINFIYEVPYEKLDGFEQKGISDVFNELVNTVKAAAFEHTGVGDEGDYLRSHYESYQITLSVYDSPAGTAFNFIISMSVLYKTSAAQEQQVNETLGSVMAALKLDGKSDYEKVRAIYDYICGHVVYDYEHLNDQSDLLHYTAYAALINGTSVCQGYSALFYRMALDAGLDCRIITGYASNGAHGWNIVRLGDRWYNLDATWDAGRKPYDYFLRGSLHFPNHTAEERFRTAAFAAEYPISSEDYSIPAETPCAHIWVDGITLREADCVTAGELQQTCSLCGSTRTASVPAKGHKLSFVPAVEASVTAEGSIAYYQCSVCGSLFADEAGVSALTAAQIAVPRLSEEGPAVQCGDVDGNRKIEAADARLALRAAVGLEDYAPGSAAFVAADADKNGKIEAGDARLILRAAVGLEAIA